MTTQTQRPTVPSARDDALSVLPVKHDTAVLRVLSSAPPISMLAPERLRPHLAPATRGTLPAAGLLGNGQNWPRGTFLQLPHQLLRARWRSRWSPARCAAGAVTATPSAPCWAAWCGRPASSGSRAWRRPSAASSLMALPSSSPPCSARRWPHSPSHPATCPSSWFPIAGFSSRWAAARTRAERPQEARLSGPLVRAGHIPWPRPAGLADSVRDPPLRQALRRPDAAPKPTAGLAWRARHASPRHASRDSVAP